MRILLDESIPKDLGMELPNHTVSTVAERGWHGTKNGELLALAAAAGFDVLITADRSMRHQQNLRRLPLSIVIMTGRNTLPALRPRVPLLLATLASMPSCSLAQVGP